MDTVNSDSAQNCDTNFFNKALALPTNAVSHVQFLKQRHNNVWWCQERKTYL